MYETTLALARVTSAPLHCPYHPHHHSNCHCHSSLAPPLVPKRVFSNDCDTKEVDIMRLTRYNYQGRVVAQWYWVGFPLGRSYIWSCRPSCDFPVWGSRSYSRSLWGVPNFSWRSRVALWSAMLSSLTSFSTSACLCGISRSQDSRVAISEPEALIWAILAKT